MRAGSCRAGAYQSSAAGGVEMTRLQCLVFASTEGARLATMASISKGGISPSIIFLSRSALVDSVIRSLGGREGLLEGVVFPTVVPPHAETPGARKLHP